VSPLQIQVDGPTEPECQIRKVQYLHRTVKDFIEKPDTWLWLTGQSWSSFDPEVSLCKANLLEAKMMVPENHYEVVKINHIASCIERAFRYASAIEPRSYSTLNPLLGEIQKLMTGLLRQYSQAGEEYMQQHFKSMLAEVQSLLCRGSTSVFQEPPRLVQKRAAQDKASGEPPKRVRKHSSSSPSAHQNHDEWVDIVSHTGQRNKSRRQYRRERGYVGWRMKRNKNKVTKLITN